MIKSRSTSIGFFTGVIMIAITLLFVYVLKYDITGNNQFVTYGIYVSGILLSLYSYKHKGHEHNPGLKNYFSEGFKCFVVATLLLVLFTIVFYKLNPEILEQALIHNEALVREQGNHTSAEIAENNTKLRSIFMPMMIGITTIKYLFIGALITLIGSGFLSKK